MTPLQIKMLHYYSISEPYAQREPQHANSPAVVEQRQILIDQGMIGAAADAISGYRVTTRGEAYVDALCAMPLPIQVWIMPPPSEKQAHP